MLSGIGDGRWPQLLVVSCKLLVLSFCLLLLAPFFHQSAVAVPTIDFSSSKNLFAEIKVGEKVHGDLGAGFPNPYEGGGMLVGYKISVPKDVDPSNLDVKLVSCAFHFAFICIGSSFTEYIYVYDGSFRPIGEDFRFKSSLSLGKIKMPEDRTLYLLVGSTDASGTGQFILSTNLKEASN